LDSAIPMETFPVEERQMAMATWVWLMIAPILGPTVGVD
jgi:hypothetical protein